MVKFGFATEELLRELKENENLDEKQVVEFRMECKSFFMKMTKKLLDKLPLSNPLVLRNMIFLDPRIFISYKKIICQEAYLHSSNIERWWTQQR